MTWALALSNFAEKPKVEMRADEGYKVCPTCEKQFIPATKHHSTTYCEEHCRSVAKAQREKEQRHARGLKRMGGPRNKLKQEIDFKRTWKDVFGPDGKVRVPLEDQPWS